MNDFNRTVGATSTMDMSTDAGLRAFMLGVYNKLALGLALAGGLAFLVGSNADIFMAIIQGLPPRYILVARITLIV